MNNPAIFITIVNIVVTTLLAIIKLIAGHYGMSHSLFADGIHSLSDVLTNFLVLFAAHYGAKQADYNHPYGHGRIETAATFVLAIIVLLAGGEIIWDSGSHLWTGKIPVKPDMYVLWVSILGLVLNEILFRVTLKVGKKIKSPLILANALHNRSDVGVSLIVLLGIIGGLLGFTYLDAIGAIFVGLMIIKMGLELGIKSISELVDTGVDEKTLEKIKAIIINVPGVRTLHLLRTRTIKELILVDVHVLVSPHISVSEGHYIGEKVGEALKQLEIISDVMVHVDPEDDEISHPSSGLPSRHEIIEIIKTRSATANLPVTKDIQLHYLNGKLEVNVLLPLKNFHDKDLEKIAEDYRKLFSDIDYISRLNIMLYSGSL